MKAAPRLMCVAGLALAASAWGCGGTGGSDMDSASVGGAASASGDGGSQATSLGSADGPFETMGMTTGESTGTSGGGDEGGSTGNDASLANYLALEALHSERLLDGNGRPTRQFVIEIPVRSGVVCQPDLPLTRRASIADPASSVVFERILAIEEVVLDRGVLRVTGPGPLSGWLDVPEGFCTDSAGGGRSSPAQSITIDAMGPHTAIFELKPLVVGIRARELYPAAWFDGVSPATSVKNSDDLALARQSIEDHFDRVGLSLTRRGELLRLLDRIEPEFAELFTDQADRLRWHLVVALYRLAGTSVEHGIDLVFDQRIDFIYRQGLLGDTGMFAISRSNEGARTIELDATFDAHDPATTAVMIAHQLVHHDDIVHRAEESIATALEIEVAHQLRALYPELNDPTHPAATTRYARQLNALSWYAINSGTAGFPAPGLLDAVGVEDVGPGDAYSGTSEQSLHAVVSQRLRPELQDLPSPTDAYFRRAYANWGGVSLPEFARFEAESLAWFDLTPADWSRLQSLGLTVVREN